MVRHIPPNTRIFIGLVIITLLSTYVALSLTSTVEKQLGGQTIKQKIQERETNLKTPPVNTSEWITYTDKQYPLSFNHPSSWEITTSTNGLGFYDINLKVPDSNEDIHVYVSKDDFYGLQGLNEKPFAVGSAKGFIVSGGLIGLKAGENYYTFDASMTPQLENQFIALVRTAKFE